MGFYDSNTTGFHHLDLRIGIPTDAAATVGDGSTVALLKAIRDALTAGLTVSDGVDDASVGGNNSAAGNGLYVLPVRATASAPSLTEGNVGFLSVDLSGNLRVSGGGGGSSDTELPNAATLADDVANPSVPGVGGFLMLFDGSTWDRARGTSADGLLVNLGANNDVTVTGTVNPSNGYGKTISRAVVAQGSAGTTQLAAASASNKHKVIGAVLTLSAAGTLKLIDGTGDLTGAFDLAQYGGFALPQNPMVPWVETAANSALSIVTTGGAAKGVVLYVTEA